MYEPELTADERACLRMWFRQAIAQVEMDEAKRALLAEHSTTPNSHSKFVAKRARRSRLNTITKELV